jgi:tetratricopeptide (TPR) repeat protein
VTGRRDRRAFFKACLRPPLVAIVVALLAPEVNAVLPAAEALFQEGRQLLAKGNLTEACARFGESYALEASSGTLLNLALCHEKQDRIATAWAEYRAAARLASSQGRDDRVAVAEGKAAALESRLPRLTFVAETSVRDLRVVGDDGALGEGGMSVGVALPVDPGVHHFTVTAPGFRSWTGTIDLKEAEQRTLRIPPLTPERPPLAITAAASIAAPLISVGVPADRQGSFRSRRLSLYLGLGGVVLLAGGTVAWSVAYAKLQSAKDACNTGPGCPDYQGRVSGIQTAQRIAIGSWIAGGVFVAASGLQYWLRERKTSLTVAIDPLEHGAALAASF